MVQLPPALLDGLHDHVVDGLGDTATTSEIARRVLTYLSDAVDIPVCTCADGTMFVATRAAPAMWLRDCATVSSPFLRILRSDLGSEGDRAELVRMLRRLLRRQWRHLVLDPYASAFRDISATPPAATAPGGVSGTDGVARAVGAGGAGAAGVAGAAGGTASPWVWERKFTLDGLALGPNLAWQLWQATGDTGWADDGFLPAARAILSTVRIEQYHQAQSDYRLPRSDGVSDQARTQRGRGEDRGPLVSPNGLVWSGFRPGGDPCQLGYNIPANHVLALALERLGELLEEVAGQLDEADQARVLAAEIRVALQEHAVVEGPLGELVWAYEIDGSGGHLFLDDANLPSLLALPYLGCVEQDDPLYLSTRRAVLSRANPLYATGLFLDGIGSTLSPRGQVWPLAKAVEGLTSGEDAVKRQVLTQLIRTDGGSGMMHESVHIDDPAVFSRGEFSAAPLLFCALALDLAGVGSGLVDSGGRVLGGTVPGHRDSVMLQP
jgi:hypothetical protein